MTAPRRPSLFQRSIAVLLVGLIELGPLATPAYAALTPLADEPLNVKNASKPNIVLTVDDSTSMLFDFLPDYVIGNYCRDSTGKMAAACGQAGMARDFTASGYGRFISPGYIAQQWKVPYTTYASTYADGKSWDVSGPGATCDTSTFPPRCSGGIDPTLGNTVPFGLERYPLSAGLAGKLYEYWTLWPAPVHNSALNKLYYNPALTYEPPVKADGSSYPQQNASETNSWKQVVADPWAFPKVLVDLTSPVTVGLWCNSDWTQGTNPATGKPYASDPAYCRTNGLLADASGGAPIADGDYTYPWVPAGISPNNPPNLALSIAYSKVDASRGRDKDLDRVWRDPKYFYENDNVIWCNTKSALWPQSGTPQPQVCQNLKPQTCAGAQDQVCKGGTAQQCNLAPQTCTATPQSCTNISAQVCNGAGTQVCGNIAPQTCNGSGPQFCANIHADTNNCTVEYDPPGCNTCVGPECGKCEIKKTCGLIGNCSRTGSACTTDAQCPDTAGSCSISGASCSTDSQCGSAGQCTLTHAACTNNTQCPAQSGTCSRDGLACSSSADCGNVGVCSVQGSSSSSNVCSTDAACAPVPGTCSVTLAICSSAAQCPDAGRCSVDNKTCTAANGCALVAGKCSVDASSCSTTDPNGASAGTCPVVAGACSETKTACTTSNQCAPTGGTCSLTNAACTSDASCAPVGTAAGNATCTDLLADGSRSLLADAAGEGLVCRRNNQSYAGVTPARYNYPDATFNFPVTGGIGPEVAFVDDALPQGANAVSWHWGDGNPAAHSGSRAHRVQVGGSSAYDQDWFQDANPPLSLQPGDFLYAWVYLDPVNPPREIMLQWYAGGADWARAYWGSNVVELGKDNTNSRRYAGPLPATGKWVRLTVPAAELGLEGTKISGMAFTLSNGTATFDDAGRAPSALYSDGGVDACTPTSRFTSVPRHYWKTSIEWCDRAVATAGDKWVGYGSSTGGSCQPFRDTTHTYPRFFAFGADPGTDNYANAAFQRVDLDIAKRNTARFTHSWKDDTGTVQKVDRSFDEEMTNYANWFAYYRTRIQAVKTVTSLVFKELDSRYRVGLHTLSNAQPSAAFLPPAEFDAGQKSTWYARLYSIAIQPGQETPNLDAMTRIGEYYRTGASAALRTSTDPIVLSCQKNWHMLFTDGLTNQDEPKPGVGNVDDKVPTLPERVLSLNPGQPWPAPYREGPTAVANSAADNATFYWVTDLRTGGTTIARNNVPVSDRDPASWQHVNFAAMSLGTEGKLPMGNQSVTEDGLRTGAIAWPQPYPNVHHPDESGVDDLWHAAINGRGRFVNAQTADELKLGMGQILQDITNQAGARSGVAFENVNLTASNRFIYRARFEPGWAGSLAKVEIDPATGAEVKEIWRASEQLTSQLAVDPDKKPTPWFTERRIVTVDSAGKAVPFRWEFLSADQQDSLAPGKPKRAAAVLEFLRGNRGTEGTKLNQFRVRAGLLGDIVNSQPVFVGAPNAPYLEANDPGYSQFRADKASRKGRIYVGANDGMLHAFDDDTGAEAWAFVPRAVYRNDGTGLGSLAYQDGALPSFQHHYLVDGTPRVVDVSFGGTDWRSLLVSGLGKGGRSYFAIDVTNPGDFDSEQNVAKKVQWEFRNDDLGYTYGKPIVTKTHAFGGRWVVIVPSGYNNVSPGTGVGKIFVVDAASGELLRTLSTGEGSSGTPSGLGHIAGYTQDYRNQMTEQVYGGDLLGNFWRFDISNTDASKWDVVKLAKLTDGASIPQPVTTAPQIEVDTVTGINRWVFVGTGKLYADSDLADTQAQTFYAIRDGNVDQPKPFTATLSRSDLKPVLNAEGIAEPDTGWYDDLPAGQRIVVAPQAALSIVAYVGTSPQTDPCLTGQPATLYARSYSGGASVLLDNNRIVESIGSEEGAVGLELLSFSTAGVGGGGAGDLGSGDAPTLRVGFTLATNATLATRQLRLSSIVVSHRMSWRLLPD